jgi:hypothetical protein
MKSQKGDQTAADYFQLSTSNIQDYNTAAAVVVALLLT